MFKLLFGANPTNFESAYSLDESVRRLSAATSASAFKVLTSQAAVGRVSRDRVSLQRVIPFVSNSFKPIFVGQFHETAGKVVLAGRFTLHWFTRAFMTFWFGFGMLWTAMATIVLAVAPQPGLWWFPLAGLGVIACGFCIVMLCKWFARNDASWLSKVIQTALSK